MLEISSKECFVTAAVCALFITAFIWFFRREKFPLPPGPCSLPFLGFLPLFFAHEPAEEVLARLSRKYGNIMSINMYGDSTIVLGNFETIKEALETQGETFSGRPDHIKSCKEEKGVIVSEGGKWHQHKKLITHSFTRLMDSENAEMLETEVMNEIGNFLVEMVSTRDNIIVDEEWCHLLLASAANSVLVLELGTRLEYDDANFIRLLDFLTPSEDEFAGVIIGAYCPWLKKLPLINKLLGTEEWKASVIQFRTFLKGLILKYQSENSFVNYYLEEKNRNIKETQIEKSINDEELLEAMHDLLVAGTETVAITLRWAFFFMVLYPHEQTKVQKEIDQVIGSDCTPLYSDSVKMPRTNAVLLEVHRLASLAPINDMHCNVTETKLFDYLIPKRTTVAANVWSVHNDPSLWKDPDKFKPERFITGSGEVQAPEHLIPFGMGVRSCLGEPFARMEIFLYFVSTLQRFSLTRVEEIGNEHDFESMAARVPKPYELKVVSRNTNR